MKFGGGHAGHNGLRSICDKLGTRDWFRVRCGIGRPPGRMPVVDWVLGRPKKEQADDFTQATHLASQAVLGLVTDGLENTQQRFNLLPPCERRACCLQPTNALRIRCSRSWSSPRRAVNCRKPP